MSWLKRIARYLPWLLGFAGAVLAWALFFRQKPSPLPDAKHELDAIRAQNEAEKMAIELGRQAALQKVEEKYREELEALDAVQKKEAEWLRDDPGQLSRYLVRAGRKRVASR